MVYNFPFRRFSYGRYSRYNNYFSYTNQFPNTNATENSCIDITKKETGNKNRYKNNEEKSSRHNNSSNFNFINFDNLFSSNINEPIIEIFGINLYLDDLIILSILFFLYKEGVQDELLFISLILLLLS